MKLFPSILGMGHFQLKDGDESYINIIFHCSCKVCPYKPLPQSTETWIHTHTHTHTQRHVFFEVEQMHDNNIKRKLYIEKKPTACSARSILCVGIKMGLAHSDISVRHQYFWSNGKLIIKTSTCITMTFPRPKWFYIERRKRKEYFLIIMIKPFTTLIIKKKRGRVFFKNWMY